MPYVRVSLGRTNLIGLLAIIDQRLSVVTTFPLAFVREMGIVDLITNSSQFYTLRLAQGTVILLPVHQQRQHHQDWCTRVLTMAPSFSKLAQQKADLFEQRMKLIPPPINFYREEDDKRYNKRIGKKSSQDYEGGETVTLSLLHDPSKKDDDKARTYKQDFPVFSDGTPEQLIKLLRDVELIIFKNMPCETAAEKARVLSSMVLAGKAKDHFTQGYEKKSSDKETLSTKKRLENGLQALKLFVFKGNHNAYGQQKYYMRYDLHFLAKEGEVAAFTHRLQELNEYLSHFPKPKDKAGMALQGFPDDELIEIVSRAQPIEYDIKCHETRFYVHENDLASYIEYLEELEKGLSAQKLLAEMQNKAGRDDKGDSSRHSGKGKRKTNKTASSEEACPHCNKPHPHHDKCWELEKNKNSRPRNWTSVKTNRRREEPAPKKQRTSYSIDQVMNIIQNINDRPNGSTKKSKRSRKHKELG